MLKSSSTIDIIIDINEGLREFWSSAKGWAPIETSELLTKSRLDWQVDLSYCLRMWLSEDNRTTEGHLILAWANLGSLIEGTLKLFISVWYEHCKSDINAVKKKTN